MEASAASGADSKDHMHGVFSSYAPRLEEAETLVLNLKRTSPVVFVSLVCKQRLGVFYCNSKTGSVFLATCLKSLAEAPRLSLAILRSAP